MKLNSQIWRAKPHQHLLCKIHRDFHNLQHALNSLRTKDTGYCAFTERNVHRQLNRWCKWDKMAGVAKFRSIVRFCYFGSSIHTGQCTFLGIGVNVTIVITDCIIVKFGLRLPVLYTMTLT